MSETIYKYVLPVALDFSQELPRGSKVLTAQMQEGSPVMWVQLDPQGVTERRYFAVRGTGWEFTGKEIAYIATWQDDGFVWHLYEVAS